MFQPTTTIATRQTDLVRFFDALFPAGLVELRAIETWTDYGKKQSRLVDRMWLAPTDVLHHFDYLDELNRGQAANIFFGVNARTSAADGTKQSVHHCRCVWMDFDGIRPFELANRLPGALREPSIVVDSGHGLHAYWLLDEPADVSTEAKRLEFESMLRTLHAAVGADTTCDVSRLLRLPGFLNVKDLRNIRQPVPCTLLRCEPYRKQPLALFFENRGEHGGGEQRKHATEQAIVLRSAELRSHRTERRIRGLVRYLDRQVDDRSRRDFWVVCNLLRLGLSVEEIGALVASHSKFNDNQLYLETTLQNAQQAVLAGG
jgi:hypothetical protein